MDPTYAGHPLQVPSKLPPQRGGFSGRILWIVIGLVIAVLLGAVLMVANQDKSGPLSQRLTDGKKNVSSDKLRKITSEGSILLAGDVTAVEAHIPEQKGKKPADLVEAESSGPSLDRLDTAKINGTYDSAYTSELTTKLETTSALTRELYQKTRNKDLRAALNTMHQHLAQLQKDLAAN